MRVTRVMRRVVCHIERASLAAALISAVSLLVGCARMDMAGNRELRRIPSPGGRLVAVVFERGWGATVAKERIEVSVLRAGAELPNEDGNVYSGDFDPCVKWRDSDTLEVESKRYGVIHSRSLWVRSGTLWWTRVRVADVPEPVDWKACQDAERLPAAGL